MLILLVTLILKRSDIASEIDTDSDIAIETDYIYICIHMDPSLQNRCHLGFRY